MNQSATIDAVAKPPRRRKLLFRVLWSLFAVVVGVCLFWTYSYYTALLERDALIAELRAKGEPVWWEGYTAKLTHEQSLEPGRDLYLRAIVALGGSTNPGPLRGVGLLTRCIEKHYENPVSIPEVETMLKKARPGFELLDRAASNPAGLPPGLVALRIENAGLGGISIDELEDGRTIARALQLESYDALANGDARRAYHATWLSLASTEHLAHEPFALAQFIRFHMIQMTAEQLAMCLAHATPPREEFAKLDALLSRWDDGLGVKQSLAAQRAYWFRNYSNPEFVRRVCQTSIIAQTKDGGGLLHRAWLEAFASPLGQPIMLRMQIEYLRLVDQLGKMFDDPKVEYWQIRDLIGRFEADCALRRAIGGNVNSGASVFAVLARDCGRTHRRLILSRLSLRLRRHFDLHGQLPETLDELCDETMPRIRLEWFGHQQITYKPSATGFRLEVPESIVHPAERSSVHNFPISSDYGFEVEFRTAPNKLGVSK